MACETLRVEQLDANVLDREMRSLVVNELDNLIGGLPISVARPCERIKSELHLVLDALLWSSRVYAGASPGQILEGIAYKDYTKEKVAGHFALSVVIPYLLERVPRLLSFPQANKTVNKIGAVIELFSIFHYLSYLRHGGHSSIVESILGLRNWNNEPPTLGTINYETQNRELLWHAFRDALLLLWPVYVVLKKTLAGRKKRAASDSARATECEACGRAAVIPMRAPVCGHLCCYWCVESRDASDREKCLVCEELNGRYTVVRGQKIE